MGRSHPPWPCSWRGWLPYGFATHPTRTWSGHMASGSSVFTSFTNAPTSVRLNAWLCFRACLACGRSVLALTCLGDAGGNRKISVTPIFETISVRRLILASSFSFKCRHFGSSSLPLPSHSCPQPKRAAGLGSPRFDHLGMRFRRSLSRRQTTEKLQTGSGTHPQRGLQRFVEYSQDRTISSSGFSGLVIFPWAFIPKEPFGYLSCLLFSTYSDQNNRDSFVEARKLEATAKPTLPTLLEFLPSFPVFQQTQTAFMSLTDLFIDLAERGFVPDFRSERAFANFAVSVSSSAGSTIAKPTPNWPSNTCNRSTSRPWRCSPKKRTNNTTKFPRLYQMVLVRT